MEKFEILRDVTSAIAYLTKFAGATAYYNAVLAADTATEVAIPSWALNGAAIFYPENGQDFYVGPATFTMPTGGFTAGAIYLNLPGVWLNGETSLFFRAPAQMRMGVAFFSRAA